MDPAVVLMLDATTRSYLPKTIKFRYINVCYHFVNKFVLYIADKIPTSAVPMFSIFNIFYFIIVVNVIELERRSLHCNII